MSEENPPERPDRPVLGERTERSERPTLGERTERPVLGERTERPVLGDRVDRGERGDRPFARETTVKSRLRAKARKKARKQKKRMFQRRKVCRFCADKRLACTYKESKTLRLFISETGKITPSRISGNCAKHQRQLCIEVKRARHLAYLPTATSHL